MLPTRDEALALLHDWVTQEPLRRHCIAVEAAMRGQARLRGGDEQLWGLTGLLHDLDYERYPDMHTGHPRYAMEELRGRGYPEEMIRAIGSHADYLGISRDTDMERALAAVDELSGFVLACARVRPTGIHGLTPKSVKKKLKEASFAAAVNREEVVATAAALGVDFDEHVRNVISSLEPDASVLGVDGNAPAAS